MFSRWGIKHFASKISHLIQLLNIINKAYHFFVKHCLKCMKLIWSLWFWNLNSDQYYDKIWYVFRILFPTYIWRFLLVNTARIHWTSLFRSMMIVYLVQFICNAFLFIQKHNHSWKMIINYASYLKMNKTKRVMKRNLKCNLFICNTCI